MFKKIFEYEQERQKSIHMTVGNLQEIKKWCLLLLILSGLNILRHTA